MEFFLLQLLVLKNPFLESLLLSIRQRRVRFSHSLHSRQVAVETSTAPPPLCSPPSSASATTFRFFSPILLEEKLGFWSSNEKEMGKNVLSISIAADEEDENDGVG
ncbi:hypothetical protein V6N13_103822 [Hibiscus sabdariffa]|uniref:Uncharacterized protein n=1 Tax=Hibiscus sabdariffa TaxID=183260 RepID=A0ABR2NTE5_9ROSI